MELAKGIIKRGHDFFHAEFLLLKLRLRQAMTIGHQQEALPIIVVMAGTKREEQVFSLVQCAVQECQCLVCSLSALTGRKARKAAIAQPCMPHSCVLNIVVISRLTDCQQSHDAQWIIHDSQWIDRRHQPRVREAPPHVLGKAGTEEDIPVSHPYRPPRSTDGNLRPEQRFCCNLRHTHVLIFRKDTIFRLKM